MADFTHNGIEITLTGSGKFQASPDGINTVESTSLAGVKKLIDRAKTVKYKPVDVVMPPYGGRAPETDPQSFVFVAITTQQYGSAFVTADKHTISGTRFCDATTFPFDEFRRFIDEQKELNRRWRAFVDTIPIIHADEVKRRMTE